MPLRNPEADAKKFGFNLGEVEADLGGVLDTLVGSAIAGRFPAVPSGEACKYCLVRSWCREKHEPSGESKKVLAVLREAGS
jgi:hypothetical protein